MTRSIGGTYRDRVALIGQRWSGAITVQMAGTAHPLSPVVGSWTTTA
jgi:hypothetical protein